MKKSIILTVLVSGLTLIAGILFFCLYNGWVTLAVSTRFTHPTSLPVAPTPTKTVTLWYWNKHELKQEKKELFWSNNPTTRCSHLIDNWLTLLDEENVTKKPCLLQALSISPGSQELFISLDRSLFNEESAAYDKWMLTESLLKTLQQAEVPFQSLRLLVHHNPLHDNHLDFSKPWPRDGFFLNTLETQAAGESQDGEDKKEAAPLTIMINPAGDAQTTGRIIHDSFERGLTLQCAEKLKEALEAKIKGVRFLLTRVAGERIDPLQHAAFANKLHVDFYLSIHFYQEDTLELPLYFYYFSYNPTSDLWSKLDSALTWIPYNQAYMSLFKKNQALAQLLNNVLQSRMSGSPFTSKQPCGIPFKPLIGILTPALACECGLKNKDDWKLLIPQLTDILSELVLKNPF